MEKSTLEAKILRHQEITNQLALLREESKLLKLSIQSGMAHHNLTTTLIRLSETHDVKVTVEEKRVKRFDKEALAEDLGITKSNAGKKEILVKLAQEGRLTGDLSRYYYEEPVTKVSIRRTKA